MIETADWKGTSRGYVIFTVPSVKFDFAITEVGFRFTTGTHRGYLLLEKDHPLVPILAGGNSDAGLKVHGGITYAEWEPYGDKFCIGFDTAHFGDTPEVQNHNFVKKELRKLAQQCLKIKEERPGDIWQNPPQSQVQAVSSPN